MGKDLLLPVHDIFTQLLQAICKRQGNIFVIDGSLLSINVKSSSFSVMTYLDNTRHAAYN